MNTAASRPITILPDGLPLLPLEWAPALAGPPRKPRPCMVRGGEAAGRGTTVPPATTPSQGRAAAKRTLDGVVSWAGGSPQAAPSRGSPCTEPGDPPAPIGAFAPVHQRPSRNVGEYSPALLNPDKADQRRLRFARLTTARNILRGTPLCTCMSYARDSGKGVQVVSYGGVAGYRGWEHCGSRLCPWCSAKLAQQDADKAERFARGWVKRKNAIAMVHYTLRHTRDETPAAVWDAQTRVLDSCHHGRPWDRFREQFGLLEHFYGNEVTQGENGTHKHQHRCWEIQMCDQLNGRAGRRLFARQMEREYTALYLAALRRHGRDALPGIALKVSIAAPTLRNAAVAAEYVTKFAKETMQGGLKSGRQGNHTVFELLDLAADKSVSAPERAAARAQYADLYFGLKGKHWSYFSEATAGESQEGGESEIPEKDLDDCGDVLLEVSALAAAMLNNQGKQCYLLELVETDGPAFAAAWLAQFSDPLAWSKEFLARFRV